MALSQVLPGVHVFLDVDDLTEGRGAESVDASNVILVFCSASYFASTNCMRELLRAMWHDKPTIALLDYAVNKGGLSPAQVLSRLEETHPY